MQPWTRDEVRVKIIHVNRWILKPHLIIHVVDERRQPLPLGRVWSTVSIALVQRTTGNPVVDKCF